METYLTTNDKIVSSDGKKIIISGHNAEEIKHESIFRAKKGNIGGKYVVILEEIVSLGN